MSVDERQRHQLYTKAVEILGQEEAEILMAHLPSGGSATLATKDDVATALRSTEHRLRTEIQLTEQRLRSEIHRVARSQLLTFISVVTLLNGALFAALRFS